MAAAVDAVFLVEASPDLRRAQRLLLCGPDAPCADSRVGRHCTGRRLGVPVVWADSIKSIPVGARRRLRRLRPRLG